MIFAKRLQSPTRNPNWQKSNRPVNGKAKGYISQALFEQLIQQGLRLVTRVRKNMQAQFYSTLDRLLLRKRAISQTINDQLKNVDRKSVV